MSDAHLDQSDYPRRVSLVFSLIDLMLWSLFAVATAELARSARFSHRVEAGDILLIMLPVGMIVLSVGALWLRRHNRARIASTISLVSYGLSLPYFGFLALGAFGIGMGR
jgi:hypothetical protein